MTLSLAWNRFRDEVRDAVLAGIPDEIARLTWSAERIDREQQQRLSRLLSHAAEHSPFHAHRLAGIDLTAIRPSDLSALPVMTKAQTMDALDDVFTDRRLRGQEIDATLAVTGTEPVPILGGDYVALASGGCSGRRALYVFDRSAMASFFTAVIRLPLADPAAPAIEIPDGLHVAMVAAPSAVHATGFAAALTSGGGWPARFDLVPATLPIAQIVERLNAMQPAMLGGYASVLTRLAHESRAGRLRITPALVSPTSETLLPEMRTLISETFGVPIVDGFACTEGLTGKTAIDEDAFVFNTDMCIAELVDADNRPVPPGVPSAKVLLTNLYNLTQPLIRYELTDVFIRQPDAAHHGYLRARVQGRSDDVLHFDGADVHPIVARSVMVRSPQVIDYQISQICSGINVFVIAGDGLDTDDLTRQLRWALVAAGLDDPHVVVKRVDHLERNSGSGKLRRFVSLRNT